MKRQKQIPHFDDINRSHEATGFSGRTDLPDFHVFTLEETYPSTRKVMPPYTLRFYCIVLLEKNSHDAVIELNTERMQGPSNTVSFQSPGHVSAWVRGEAQRGFILYFQPEFLIHGSVASYGISKAALNALTTKLAAELEGTSILVNAVCPGLTATAPDMEAMGARPVEQGAASVAWAVTLPDDGPTGGSFRDGKPLPW